MRSSGSYRRRCAKKRGRAGSRPSRGLLVAEAAALVAAGRADFLTEAIPLAVNSRDSGAARAKLKSLVEFTNRQ